MDLSFDGEVSSRRHRRGGRRARCPVRPVDRCVVVQSPDFLGRVLPPAGMRRSQTRRTRGALLVVAANPVALGMLEPPGNCGADVVAGEGSRSAARPASAAPTSGSSPSGASTSAVERRIAGETADRKDGAATSSPSTRANSTSGARRPLEHLLQRVARGPRRCRPPRRARARGLRRVAELCCTTPLRCREDRRARRLRGLVAGFFTSSRCAAPSRPAW